MSFWQQQQNEEEYQQWLDDPEAQAEYQAYLDLQLRRENESFNNDREQVSETRRCG